MLFKSKIFCFVLRLTYFYFLHRARFLQLLIHLLEETLVGAALDQL
jgi:hypothetical protein